jgi:hypothetical protein
MQANQTGAVGSITAALVAGFVALAAPTGASAEAYAGFGLGRASVELDGFDENDSAQKLIVGYIFDLPAVDFSVEGGYVDFGSPRDGGALLEITGLDAFAVAGVDFGLVGIFGKAGLMFWDADASAPGISASDDGSDPAYGIGLRFNVGSAEIRTEYERFEIDEIDDLNLISASVIWRF